MSKLCRPVFRAAIATITGVPIRRILRGELSAGQGREPLHNRARRVRQHAPPRNPPDKLANQQLEPATTANTPAAWTITPPLELLAITTRGWIFTPRASHLRDLPNLKTLVIRGDDYSETAPRWFRLDANLFENNPALEVVEIRLDTNNTQIAIAKDTLNLLHGLKEISLSPYSDSEISLSLNSPLMKDILNGRKSPNGYTLIPPGATSP